MQIAITSRVVTVTPAMARDWLNNSNYKNNRPVRNSIVNTYADDIKNGQFVAGSPINFGVYKEQYHLLDGQHRLYAIIKANTGLIMTVTDSIVENETDLAIMYSKFDRQWKRNSGDTYRAFGLPEETGLLPRHITKASAAVVLILGNFSFYKRKFGYSQDELIMEYIKCHKKAIRDFYDITEGCSEKMRSSLERSTTLSIAILTLDKPHPLATDFWARVADGDKLDKTDPRFWLREKLLLTRNSGSYSVNDSVTKMSSVSLCRMVALGWNMYAQGREMKRNIVTIPNTVTLHPFGITI